MTDDYQFHYNSPKNPKCWTCGEPITFDTNKRGQNGKPIPLNPYTKERHQHKEPITSQESTVINKIESDGSEPKGSENQNKYPNKLRLDLPPQHIIAELHFPNPKEYNEIIAKLDNLTNSVNNLTNRVEEINQNQDRITEIDPSSFDNDNKDTNKNQSLTEDQNV